MRVAVALVSMLLALPFVPSAHADTFSGQGGSFSGSGTLATTSNGDGSYTITNVSGMGFNGLIASGGFQGNDNLLFPGGTSLVDANGFAFTYTQGNTNYDVDILSTTSGNYAANFTDLDSNTAASLAVTLALTGTSQTASLFQANDASPTNSFDFSFSADPTGPAPSTLTPEPSSLILLGTGIVGMFGAIGRKSRVR